MSDAIPFWRPKAPGDIRRYGLKGWKAHLGGVDKVISCTWSAYPAGLTVEAFEVEDDGDRTSFRSLGGEAHVPYLVTCRATLESGEQVDRSGYLRVIER